MTKFEANWTAKFQEYRVILGSVFQDIPIAFHFIENSSNSRIDILGVTSDLTKIDSYTSQLQALGFASLGEFGSRHCRFYKKEDVWLQIFEDSDPEVCRRLRSITYLHSHPEAINSEIWIKQIDHLAAKEKLIPHFYPPLGPRKMKWTLSEIIEAMHVNLYLQMTYFSKYHPFMEFIYQPDVTVVRSEIGVDMFNYVVNASFTEENVSERIKCVLRLFREDHLPFSWWISLELDTPHDLGKHLMAQGLSLQEREVGMYLELYDRTMSRHEHLIRRVEFPEIARDYCEVIVSFGGHKEMFETIYKNIPPILYQEGAPMELYVLYREGQPVTTGMAVFHANVMGIYYIATCPEYRRKGFGTAMMEYLLDRAQSKGYYIATLQASPQGKSLYERLGFSECCQFCEFG